MKKFLLSIFAVLFAFAGAQAQETKTVELLPSHLEGKGTSGTGSEMEYTIAPITFVFSKGYGASGNMRAYKSSTITISGATIKSVNFTATSSSYNPDMTVNTGSVSKNGATSTWTGEAASVEFTVGAQLRATSILVTYVESSVATPVVTFEGDAGAFEDKITVNVSSKAPAYYTLNGETPDENSDLCPSVLTIKADATLRVVAIKDGERSALVTQEFKKAISGESAGETTLVTDASTLAVGDQIVIVASDSDYALSTTQNGNNRGRAPVTKDGNNITYGADVQIITLEDGSVDGTFAFNVGTGYLYAASSSNNYLRTNANLDNNGSWTVSVTDGIASIIAQGSNTRNMMQYNQTSSIFSCYASDKPQKDISIYKINKATIEAYTLTVGNAGWATLFLNYDAEIPAGVTCYAVSAVDGEYATLAEVEGVIPANTGVIVEAEAGNYIFEVATEAGSDVAKELIGTTVNTYITKEAYVLGIVDDVVGLYKAEMAGGVWLNNANKAYLPASVASGAASYSFRFGEGTTGISEVKGESGNVKGIYDLTGRRVETITVPGIYVVGGKKVLVK